MKKTKKKMSQKMIAHLKRLHAMQRKKPVARKAPAKKTPAAKPKPAVPNPAVVPMGTTPPPMPPVTPATQPKPAQLDLGGEELL